MRVSKISAKATYHKCIKELNNYGYLRYEPSFNPIRGSLVYLFNFETPFELVNESSHTKINTPSRQLEEPYINNTNIINSKLAYEPANESTVSNQPESTEVESTTHLRAGGKRIARGAGIPASVEETRSYFEEQMSTPNEGEKFFNYFQSNGWKVGGKAKMKDWQAAARNWILNVPKYDTKPKPSTLHTKVTKNYAEPL